MGRGIGADCKQALNPKARYNIRSSGACRIATMMRCVRFNAFSASFSGQEIQVAIFMNAYIMGLGVRNHHWFSLHKAFLPVNSARHKIITVSQWVFEIY